MADTVVPIKIMAVCGHCFVHNHNNAMIEYNFKDQMVYYVCPECKKSNSMGYRPIVAQPLPKAKLSR